MPTAEAPSWRLRLTRGLAALALLAGGSALTPAAAQDENITVPILAPPPSAWDSGMLSGRPLFSQTVTDFSALTGGILFGMGPAEVNGRMPNPAKGIVWGVLPSAAEFPDDVRYFWIRFDDARDLRMGTTACVGSDSYIVFLFQSRGLFRISYRLVPDVACPRPADAALQIFSRYVTISTDLALSVHYRAGAMEIVDVSDATASRYLMATRWQPRAEQ